METNERNQDKHPQNQSFNRDKTGSPTYEKEDSKLGGKDYKGVEKPFEKEEEEESREGMSKETGEGHDEGKEKTA